MTEEVTSSYHSMKIDTSLSVPFVYSSPIESLQQASKSSFVFSTVSSEAKNDKPSADAQQPIKFSDLLGIFYRRFFYCIESKKSSTVEKKLDSLPTPPAKQKKMSRRNFLLSSIMNAKQKK